MLLMQCRPAVSASREPGAHLHVFQLRHCSACYADGGQEPTCRYLSFFALEMFVCVFVPVPVSISVLVSVYDFYFSIPLSVGLSVFTSMSACAAVSEYLLCQHVYTYCGMHQQ